MEVRLTVVELDLVGSSKPASDVESILGPHQGTRTFLENSVKSFVEKAFSKYSEYDSYKTIGGDGYRLSFDDASNAYEFVKKFSNLVKEHNKVPRRIKLIFCLGAATGEVSFNESQSNLDAIMGQYVCSTAKQLREKAKPGYFYVDDDTFKELPDTTGFETTKVQLKSGQYIDTWYIRVIPDISTSTKQLTLREEVNDGLAKLTNNQIIKVARDIDMDENELTIESVQNSRGTAILKILDYAKIKNIYSQLKNTIQQLNYPKR